jgi:hypothetical protein
VRWSFICNTRDLLLDLEIHNTLLTHKNACRYWEDGVIVSTQSLVVQVNYQPAPLDRLLCYVYGQGIPCAYHTWYHWNKASVEFSELLQLCGLKVDATYENTMGATSSRYSIIITSKAVRPAVSISSLARVLEILTRYHQEPNSPITSQLDNDGDLSPCIERVGVTYRQSLIDSALARPESGVLLRVMIPCMYRGHLPNVNRHSDWSEHKCKWYDTRAILTAKKTSHSLLSQHSHDPWMLRSSMTLPPCKDWDWHLCQTQGQTYHWVQWGHLVELFWVLELLRVL